RCTVSTWAEPVFKAGAAARRRPTWSTSMAKKATRSTTSPANKTAQGSNAEPPALQVKQRAWHEPGPEPYTDASQKNGRLSGLLAQAWNMLDIVSVRRMEIGGQGWEATYRVVGA